MLRKTSLLNLAAVAFIAAACRLGSDDVAGPRELDLSGDWYGANAVAALDVHLSNGSVSGYCNFCSGNNSMRTINLDGTYTDLRTDEVIDLDTYTERRADGGVYFDLFGRQEGNYATGITYATVRLIGQAYGDSTIHATLQTDYQQSAGGSTVTWTTWSAEIYTITLRRR